MSAKPGSIYKIGNRRYVDSQAVYNLAGAHEVVPLPDGWRVVVAGGAVRCAAVEERPALPSQRGALYEMSAEGGVSLKAQRDVWTARGLVRAGGSFESWPGEQPAKTSCGCGNTCGCAPCRHKHASHPEHT